MDALEKKTARLPPFPPITCLPMVAYGLDTGPNEDLGKDWPEDRPGAYRCFSIEVVPYRRHALTRLVAGDGVIEAIEVVSLHVARTPASLGVPSAPALYEGEIEKVEDGWLITAAPLVEVGDPVVLEIKLVKPIPRVTITACGDPHPMDGELVRLFNALRAEKHPAMSVYDERARMVSIALAGPRKMDPRPTVEFEGIEPPPFKLFGSTGWDGHGDN